MNASTYILAAESHLSGLFTGWPIAVRSSNSPTAANRPWSVELAIEDFSLAGELRHPQAVVNCVGTVHYEAKAPTHQYITQALDIAMGFAAYLREKYPPTFTFVYDANAHGPELQQFDGETSQQIENIEADVFPNLAMPGQYDVEIRWQDTIDITQQLTIPGYESQAPPVTTVRRPLGDTGGVGPRITGVGAFEVEAR